MTDLQNSTTPPLAYSECYVQPFFTFYNADNMAIMKTFKDKEFDLAIVDPPYGIGLHVYPDGITRVKQKPYKSTNSSLVTWDYDKPQPNFINEIIRVSKNQIFFGANHYIESINKNSSCWLIFDKMNGESRHSDAELAWTSFPFGVRICKKQWFGSNSHREGKRIHPTQKPIDLYGYIINKFCEPNQKILDPNLGSGSIAIAIDKANTLDKKNLTFVGIELDHDYFRSAVERFKNHKRQCVLF